MIIKNSTNKNKKQFIEALGENEITTIGYSKTACAGVKYLKQCIGKYEKIRKEKL